MVTTLRYCLRCQCKRPHEISPYEGLRIYVCVACSALHKLHELTRD
jgi:hypothetical protein